MHLPMILRAIATTLMVGWFFHNSGVVKARVISALDSLDTSGGMIDSSRLVKQPENGQAILKDQEFRIRHDEHDMSPRDYSPPPTPLGGRPPKTTTGPYQHTTSIKAPSSASIGVEIISVGAAKSNNGEHTSEAPKSGSANLERDSGGVAPPPLPQPHKTNIKRAEQSGFLTEFPAPVTTVTITTQANFPIPSPPCGLFQPAVDTCLAAGHLEYDACPLAPALLHQCRCAAFSKKVKCLELSNCRNHPQYPWFQQQEAIECGLAQQWPILGNAAPHQLMFTRVRSLTVPTTTTLLTNGASALIQTTVATVPVTETVMSDGAIYTGQSFPPSPPPPSSREDVQTNGSGRARGQFAVAAVAAISSTLTTLGL